MSEQKFQAAKGNLAFSQTLKDRLTQSQSQPMADQSLPPQQTPQQPDMAQQPAAQSQTIENPQEEQQSIIQTIKDTLMPFMDKIVGLISKDVQEDKTETPKA